MLQNEAWPQMETNEIGNKKDDSTMKETEAKYALNAGETPANRSL